MEENNKYKLGTEIRNEIKEVLQNYIEMFEEEKYFDTNENVIVKHKSRHFNLELKINERN